jgi:hypothetical protein
MRDENSKEYYESRAIDYEERCRNLEKECNEYKKETEYYRDELAKSHAILGRVIHQLSERWDSVRLTKYYPTDNLCGKRTIGNVEGRMNNDNQNRN